MSISKKKDGNVEEPMNPFLGFTVGVYNIIITVFAVFIAWLFYSDVVQHLGYTPISFLYFYFSYMIVNCFFFMLKTPAEVLLQVDKAKSAEYKTFARVYPTVKTFVIAVSYGLFKVIEWIFV